MSKKILQDRLEQLSDGTGYIQHPTIHKRRSISECSSGVSSTSSNSEPEMSENAELFESNLNAARLLHSFANFKVQIEADNKKWAMSHCEPIINGLKN